MDDTNKKTDEDVAEEKTPDTTTENTKAADEVASEEQPSPKEESLSSETAQNEAVESTETEPEVSENESQVEELDQPAETVQEEVTEAADSNDNTGDTETTSDLAKDEQVFEEPDSTTETQNEADDITETTDGTDDTDQKGKWYVVHTYSGHENRVATALRQRIESEHLEHKIFDILVPTQDKIEIRAGKKEQVKEKIFPGYILVKMDLDDASWLAVRTTQGVTSFVGIGNKPTPISEHEVKGIRKFMTQGATSTFKDIFAINDTVKIIDGPFSDFIGKVDAVDKEKGKVRVLVSIFGRETPVELDFLQVQKL